MNEKPIEVMATLQEVRGARLAMAVLPNGKVIYAHSAKDLSQDLRELPLGALLYLEMTPYDFEKGRIVAVKESA